MRLIDADEAKEELKERYMAAVEWQKNTIDYKQKAEGAIMAFLETIRALNNEPTIDAEPVIRCKDCKWFGELGCAIKIMDETDKPNENDFCSFGERRKHE